MVYAEEGFPTPDNRGMMTSIVYVLSSLGVVVVDTIDALRRRGIAGDAPGTGT